MWNCAILLSVVGLCGSQVFPIPEEKPEGTFVANVAINGVVRDGSGRELNLEQRLSLKYRLFSDEGINNARFTVVKETGVLLTAKRLNRESICPDKPRCTIPLNIVAFSEDRVPEFFRIFRVEVRVDDINDNSPRFPNSQSQLSIPESVQKDSMYQISGAIDRDAGENSRLTYSIEPEVAQFELVVQAGSPETLFVKVLAPLDRETRDTYRLRIIAADAGTPSRNGSTLVIVRVTDVNDHSPQFERKRYTATIKENSPAGTPVVTVKATDRDMGDNALVTYGYSYIVTDARRKQFELNSSSGEITIQESVDYELDKEIELIIEARDSGNPVLTSRVSLIVDVTDENDNAPKLNFNFLSDERELTLEEAVYSKKFIAHLSVSDRDSGQNAQVNCKLLKKSSLFSLQKIFARKYQIVLYGRLDREAADAHNITVCCSDRGIPRKSTCDGFCLLVSDINDSPPVFERSEYFAKIREDFSGFLLDLRVSDADSGENSRLSFDLTVASSHADANPNITVTPDGKLFVVEPLNRESLGSHIMIYVTARDHGNPALSASSTVDITLDDINDEKPEFNKDHYLISLRENTYVGRNNSLAIGRVNASDSDLGMNGMVGYSFVKSRFSPLFTIDNFTGVIYVNQSFDREMRDLYHLVVMATDQGRPPLNNSVDVTVLITDMNDNAPIFVFPSPNNYIVNITHQSNTLKDAVATVNATDSDFGRNGIIRYSISRDDNRRFSIDNETGKITTNKKFYVGYANIFNLLIIASDMGQPMKYTSQILVINVNISYVSSDHQNDAIPQGVLIAIILVIVAVFFALIAFIFVVYIKRCRRVDKNRVDKYRSWVVTSLDSDQSLTDLRGTNINRSVNFDNTGMELEISREFRPSHHSLAMGDNSAKVQAFNNGERRLASCKPMSQSSLGIVWSNASCGDGDLSRACYNLNRLSLPQYPPGTNPVPVSIYKENFFDLSSDTSITSDSGRGASEEGSRDNDSSQWDRYVQRDVEKPTANFVRTMSDRNLEYTKQHFDNRKVSPVHHEMSQTRCYTGKPPLPKHLPQKTQDGDRVAPRSTTLLASSKPNRKPPTMTSSRWRRPSYLASLDSLPTLVIEEKSKENDPSGIDSPISDIYEIENRSFARFHQPYYADRTSRTSSFTTGRQPKATDQPKTPKTVSFHCDNYGSKPSLPLDVRRLTRESRDGIGQSPRYNTNNSSRTAVLQLYDNDTADVPIQSAV